MVQQAILFLKFFHCDSFQHPAAINSFFKASCGSWVRACFTSTIILYVLWSYPLLRMWRAGPLLERDSDTTSIHPVPGGLIKQLDMSLPTSPLCAAMKGTSILLAKQEVVVVSWARRSTVLVLGKFKILHTETWDLRPYVPVFQSRVTLAEAG